MVVRDLAKVEARVRFPYPAPLLGNVYKGFFAVAKSVEYFSQRFPNFRFDLILPFGPRFDSKGSLVAGMSHSVVGNGALGGFLAIAGAHGRRSGYAANQRGHECYSEPLS